MHATDKCMATPTTPTGNHSHAPTLFLSLWQGCAGLDNPCKACKPCAWGVLALMLCLLCTWPLALATLPCCKRSSQSFPKLGPCHSLGFSCTLCCCSFRCLKRGWSSQQVGADTRIGRADWSDWHISLWFYIYKCITSSRKRRSLLQACFQILPCRIYVYICIYITELCSKLRMFI